MKCDNEIFVSGRSSVVHRIPAKFEVKPCNGIIVLGWVTAEVKLGNGLIVLGWVTDHTKFR